MLLKPARYQDVIENKRGPGGGWREGDLLGGLCRGGDELGLERSGGGKGTYRLWSSVRGNTSSS